MACATMSCSQLCRNYRRAWYWVCRGCSALTPPSIGVMVYWISCNPTCVLCTVCSSVLTHPPTLKLNCVRWRVQWKQQSNVDPKAVGLACLEMQSKTCRLPLHRHPMMLYCKSTAMCSSLLASLHIVLWITLLTLLMSTHNLPNHACIVCHKMNLLSVVGS